MLSAIRNKYKGWLAYTIVAFITIPFALFGINQYFTGQSNIIVAFVNGEEIYKEEFLLRFNAEKERLQELLAEDYEASFDVKLKERIINNIVDEHLFKEFSNELGLVTTDAELRSSIENTVLFQEDGVFSIDRYKQALRLIGYSNIAYETAKLKELTQSQIKRNLLDSAFVTASILNRFKDLTYQERKFDYVVINANDYLGDTVLDEESIDVFYKNKKELFFEPQKVSVDYIELAYADIVASINADDEVLLGVYESEQQRYTTDEQRRAQHILLADEDTAQMVLELLNKGGDFAKLAFEYSQDTDTKDNAGDLGFLAKGVIGISEFDERIFTMVEGEISDLVVSDFGYHIIRLAEIKESFVEPFESVRSQLADFYKEQEAQKTIYSLLEELANLAYEGSLEYAAEQMGLKIKTSEYFYRDSIDYDKIFVRTAFSDAVLNSGENSIIITLPEDRFAVLRLKDNIPRRDKTLAESKDEIKQQLSLLLARTFVDNVANDLVDLLVVGEEEEVESLMDISKVRWVQAGWVTRNARVDYGDIIDKVFTLAKPKKDEVIYAAENLTENSVVVIKLLGVKTTDNNLDADFSSLLLDFESDETMLSIIRTLRANAEVEILTKNL